MQIDSTNSWFLPESIQEFIPPEAESVDTLRRKLLDLYFSYGYQLVMPPLAEYRDALVSGAGADLADITLNLHSSPDERSLGIRSDFTPQIARIDSQHQNAQTSGRYCYFGETFLTRPRKPLGSRNPFQAGVELFGSNRISADEEMVELMLASIRQEVDDGLHLQLGHIGIFRRLCQLAELDNSKAKLCEQIMRRRSFTDIASFSKAHINDDVVSLAMQELPRMVGSVAVLDKARALLSPLDESIAEAVEHMQSISDSIHKADETVEVVIDCADVRGYSYHNALLYSCYCKDKLLAQGGRYDGIGKYFGHEKSATGFSIDIDALLLWQHIKATDLVWVEKNQRQTAEQWIKSYRSGGGRCIIALDSSEQPPAWCSHRLKQEGNGWKLVTI